MTVGETVLTVATAADVLDLVSLSALMARTSGSADIAIGLVDGPVLTRHPDLAGCNIREIGGSAGATGARADSVACRHGTFVAGILSARRGSAAPAICPDCVLLVRPIFSRRDGHRRPGPERALPKSWPRPSWCVDAGARLMNVSAALAAMPNAGGGRALEQALDHAWHRGAIVVAAAGNQGRGGRYRPDAAPRRHRGQRLRPFGVPLERVEPRAIDRTTRVARAWGRHHESRHRHGHRVVRRHERGGSVRDRMRSRWRGRCFRGRRWSGPIGRDPGAFSAAAHRRPAVAQRWAIHTALDHLVRHG